MPENIANKIYTIRGQKVMLDYNLAKIYGYTTKAFNQQVKNNIRKFEGEDFMFQLTRPELEQILRCNFCTSSLGSDNLKCHFGTSSSDSTNLMCNFCTSSSDSGNLRSKFLTSSWGGGRYLPYAFTEPGIYKSKTISSKPAC